MQSKNKNDSVQLSTRYQQYDFAKRHLRGECGGEVFPFGRSSKQTTKKETRGVQANCLTATCHKGAGNDGMTLVQLNKPKHSNDRVYSDEGLSPTLNTMQGGNRQPFIAPVLTPDRAKKRQNGRRFKENGEPSFTLTAQDKHGIYDGTRIRRLTPLECERLMGFPDNWTEFGIDENGKGTIISDTQRYKTCGNGVVVNVVKEIMKKLISE
jgi:DNA (cytosine-5)-methyltransferase 1